MINDPSEFMPLQEPCEGCVSVCPPCRVPGMRSAIRPPRRFGDPTRQPGEPPNPSGPQTGGIDCQSGDSRG